MSRLRTLLAALLTVALMSGCSSEEDSGGPLPDGQALLRESAAAMKDVTSVGFALTTEGEPAGLPVKAMNGELLRNGDAQGDVTAVQMGLTIEAKFVLVGPDLYFNLAGGYQKTGKSMITSILDPSAILDPERGIPLMLSQATGAKTEAREDGTVRIAASLPGTAVAGLGVKTAQTLQGTVWINEDDKRLTKVLMNLEGGSATLTLADFNANPAIEAPKQ
ncbi:LppX_LprAFG lipoprotein [Actinocorallia populi]|uniref:LppX_LprAFG lipoprotein n=1 Tax=Actinocorallia populi TaxID=2079200 RepID=UPI000D087052|nr:LppX_LprAFG lipoprotein [Actinocorallia populi]